MKHFFLITNPSPPQQSILTLRPNLEKVKKILENEFQYQYCPFVAVD